MIYWENSITLKKLYLLSQFFFALLVIFLHNPIDGYSTTEVVKVSQQVETSTKDCPTSRYQAMLAKGRQAMSFDENIEFDSMLNKCLGYAYTDHVEEQTLPPTEWRSREPLIGWLAPILHVLLALVCIALAGYASMVIFRNPTPQPK